MSWRRRPSQQTPSPEEPPGRHPHHPQLVSHQPLPLVRTRSSAHLFLDHLTGTCTSILRRLSFKVRHFSLSQFAAPSGPASPMPQRPSSVESQRRASGPSLRRIRSDNQGPQRSARPRRHTTTNVLHPTQLSALQTRATLLPLSPPLTQRAGDKTKVSRVRALAMNSPDAPESDPPSVPARHHHHQHQQQNFVQQQQQLQLQLQQQELAVLAERLGSSSSSSSPSDSQSATPTPGDLVAAVSLDDNCSAPIQYLGCGPHPEEEPEDYGTLKASPLCEMGRRRKRHHGHKLTGVDLTESAANPVDGPLSAAGVAAAAASAASVRSVDVATWAPLALDQCFALDLNLTASPAPPSPPPPPATCCQDEDRMALADLLSSAASKDEQLNDHAYHDWYLSCDAALPDDRDEDDVAAAAAAAVAAVAAAACAEAEAGDDAVDQGQGLSDVLVGQADADPAVAFLMDQLSKPTCYLDEEDDLASLAYPPDSSAAMSSPTGSSTPIAMMHSAWFDEYAYSAYNTASKAKSAHAAQQQQQQQQQHRPLTEKAYPYVSSPPKPSKYLDNPFNPYDTFDLYGYGEQPELAYLADETPAVTPSAKTQTWKPALDLPVDAADANKILEQKTLDPAAAAATLTANNSKQQFCPVASTSSTVDQSHVMHLSLCLVLHLGLLLRHTCSDLTVPKQKKKNTQKLQLSHGTDVNLTNKRVGLSINFFSSLDFFFTCPTSGLRY